MWLFRTASPANGDQAGTAHERRNTLPNDYKSGGYSSSSKSAKVKLCPECKAAGLVLRTGLLYNGKDMQLKCDRCFKVLDLTGYFYCNECGLDFCDGCVHGSAASTKKRGKGGLPITGRTVRSKSLGPTELKRLLQEQQGMDEPTAATTAIEIIEKYGDGIEITHTQYEDYYAGVSTKMKENKVVYDQSAPRLSEEMPEFRDALACLYMIYVPSIRNTMGPAMVRRFLKACQPNRNEKEIAERAVSVLRDWGTDSRYLSFDQFVGWYDSAVIQAPDVVAHDLQSHNIKLGQGRLRAGNQTIKNGKAQKNSLRFEDKDRSYPPLEPEAKNGDAPSITEGEKQQLILRAAMLFKDAEKHSQNKETIYSFLLEQGLSHRDIEAAYHYFSSHSKSVPEIVDTPSQTPSITPRKQDEDWPNYRKDLRSLFHSYITRIRPKMGGLDIWFFLINCSAVQGQRDSYTGRWANSILEQYGNDKQITFEEFLKWYDDEISSVKTNPHRNTDFNAAKNIKLKPPPVGRQDIARMKVGQTIAVLSPGRCGPPTWRLCTIMGKRSTDLLIHYEGFTHAYDEWIDIDSTRLQPEEHRRISIRSRSPGPQRAARANGTNAAGRPADSGVSAPPPRSRSVTGRTSNSAPSGGSSRRSSSTSSVSRRLSGSQSYRRGSASESRASAASARTNGSPSTASNTSVSSASRRVASTTTSNGRRYSGGSARARATETKDRAPAKDKYARPASNGTAATRTKTTSRSATTGTQRASRTSARSPLKSNRASAYNRSSGTSALSRSTYSKSSSKYSKPSTSASTARAVRRSSLQPQPSAISRASKVSRKSSRTGVRSAGTTSRSSSGLTGTSRRLSSSASERYTSPSLKSSTTASRRYSTSQVGTSSRVRSSGSGLASSRRMSSSATGRRLGNTTSPPAARRTSSALSSRRAGASGLGTTARSRSSSRRLSSSQSRSKGASADTGDTRVSRRRPSQLRE